MTLSCGHEPSPHGDHTTGTAHLPDGREVCWTCADAWQRDQMATSDRLFAYLSSDGQAITTWSGGTLARVTGHTTARVGFRDVTGKRPTRHYVRAVDAAGKHWRGTSPGPGMYARLVAAG